MQFPPEVEQWRTLVAKYFPPDLVDKALWTIQHESSGNAGAVGDNGVARGLFQVQDSDAFPNRPQASYLDDPEHNIAYAAQQLGAANGDFSAWGDNGNTYNGQPFGAFGDNQYPGDTTATVGGFSRGVQMIPVDPSTSGSGSATTGGSGTVNDPTMNAYGVSSNPWGFSDGMLNQLAMKYPGVPLAQAAQAAADAIAKSQAAGGVTPDTIYTGTHVSAYDQALLAAQAARDKAAADAQAAATAATLRGQDISAGTAAASNATTQRGQDISAQNTLAQIAQAKYDSDLRWQTGMASATTAQQRNQIDAQHYAEQAVIAQMQNATTEHLGEQGNQVQQYGSELNHAAAMGNLAEQTNKDIAQFASSPRNDPALYFMQRGYAPDWNTLAQGGQLARGAAWAPTDPQKAYVPVTKPVDFSTPWVNPYASQVGQHEAAGVAISQQPNPYISAQPPAQYAPPAYTPPAQVAPYQPPQAAGYGPPAATQQVSRPVDTVTGAAPTNNAFNWDTARMTEGGIDNRAVADVPSGGYWTGMTGHIGTSAVPDYQGWTVLNPSTGQPWDSSTPINPDTQLTLRRMAYGGMTRARQFLAGDANAPDPSAGGALPEVIQNPTGAPLSVVPNPQNMQQMGPPPGQPMMPMDPTAQMNRVLMGLGKRPLMRRFALGTADQQGAGPSGIPINYGNDNQMNDATSAAAQNAYNANGLGSAWLPTSNNSYARSQPTPMPTLLNNLAGYGYPVTPALYSAATGSNMPTQNFAAAFGQTAGGGNAMPSLQSLNHMTPSEMEYYRGYIEGPMGVPWSDLTNYIASGTANLGKAADARGSF